MIDVGQMADILAEKEKTKQKRLKYERDVKVVQTVAENRQKGKDHAGLIGLAVFIVIFAVCFIAMKMNGV